MTTFTRLEGLVSVIVAINPHDHDLAVVFDAWAGQVAAGEFEVIVVHDGCRPSLPAEYAAHRLRHPSSPVRWVSSGTPGRAASNNAGVLASRGGLLAFVADDFRPSAGLVAAHRAYHERIGRPAVGIGPGYFDDSRRADPFVRWLEDSGAIWGISFVSGRLLWREDFFYVGNASMPREVFEATGPFDETYRNDLFDDWEFGQRLASTGVSRHLVPRAIAWHDHDVTLAERLVAARRMGECMSLHERRLALPPEWRASSASPPLEELERIAHDAARRAAESSSFADRRAHWRTALALAVERGYAGVPERLAAKRSA
jgi:GT2 family glycosyltransferase